MAQHTFPSGFFTTLTHLSSDTLTIATNWCDENAQEAPLGSRSRKLWASRCEALISAIKGRGAYMARLDARSPYIILTKDEYTALVNSPHRLAMAAR